MLPATSRRTASRVLALLAACALAVPAGAEETSARLRLADGLELAYVARGAGDPALVFVHCGNCRLEMWSETLDAFAGEHRVVALDLAGHGRSGANRERFSIASDGADVAALVEHLALPHVILVGNSLGGPVALEAARRLGPQRVFGVVAVDTLQNVELEYPEDAWRAQLAAFEKDFGAACDAMMLGIVGKGASAEARARVARDTCDDVPRAMISRFETLRTYDQGAALKAAGVPVRAINGDWIPTALEVNRKYEPTFDAVILPGVGHYPQIERPAEFQRALRATVAALTAAANKRP